MRVKKALADLAPSGGTSIAANTRHAEIGRSQDDRISSGMVYRSPGKQTNGVLYWHEAKVPHLMRVHLIVVELERERLNDKLRTELDRTLRDIIQRYATDVPPFYVPAVMRVRASTGSSACRAGGSPGGATAGPASVAA